jgi:uncharacterized membrane protein
MRNEEGHLQFLVFFAFLVFLVLVVSVVSLVLAFLVFLVLSMRYTSVFCTLGTPVVSPGADKICGKNAKIFGKSG